MGESFSASDLMDKMRSEVTETFKETGQPNMWQLKTSNDLIVIIKDAHQEVVDSFDKVTNKWKRKAIKQFINGEVVRKVEDAVLKQFQLALNSSSVPVINQAKSRVCEGMEYWKRIILKKMEGWENGNQTCD